jgi:hypothetical protein
LKFAKENAMSKIDQIVGDRDDLERLIKLFTLGAETENDYRAKVTTVIHELVKLRNKLLEFLKNIHQNCRENMDIASSFDIQGCLQLMRDLRVKEFMDPVKIWKLKTKQQVEDGDL